MQHRVPGNYRGKYRKILNYYGKYTKLPKLPAAEPSPLQHTHRSTAVRRGTKRQRGEKEILGQPKAAEQPAW